MADPSVTGEQALQPALDFVFVHSYSSRGPNWRRVQIGSPAHKGRVLKALELAASFGVSVIADDACDAANARCYQEHGITNLGSARNTRDEVRSALGRSRTGRVLFVTSPDHLPRVVRDVLGHAATGALFAASDVPFSRGGVAAVVITEPEHAK